MQSLLSVPPHLIDIDGFTRDRALGPDAAGALSDRLDLIRIGSLAMLPLHWQALARATSEKLDAFLSFNDRQVLVGAGKVSHKQAVAHAQSEYEQFAAQRRAALEAEGEACAVRMLGAASADDGALEELGKVAKRLTKKKGGRDAA